MQIEEKSAGSPEPPEPRTNRRLRVSRIFSPLPGKDTNFPNSLLLRIALTIARTTGGAEDGDTETERKTQEGGFVLVSLTGGALLWLKHELPASQRF